MQIKTLIIGQLTGFQPQKCDQPRLLPIIHQLVKNIVIGRTLYTIPTEIEEQEEWST